MCPLRFILVFISATLAGYLAWRSIRSPSDDETQDNRETDASSLDRSVEGRVFHAGKVIGDGFWVFVDMASGRYLWRAMKERKKLDPLDAYVPAVLLTRAQFEDLEKTLDIKQPKYDFSRSLLRSGPAASLRINIRAVAQYATDDGKGRAASNSVDECLRALEELDSLLLHASRKDPTASVESMKIQINIALGALDSLLQTVPPAVLDKGKAIADAYRVPSNEEGSISEDPEIKQLQEIL